MVKLSKLFLKDPNEPPCKSCTGACCKKGDTGHEFAVFLYPDEEAKFKDVAEYNEGDQSWVIPYKKDRCIYLGKDDRCSIYDKRPKACQQFSCCSIQRDGRLSFFLEDSPKVLTLLLKEGYLSPELIERINIKHDAGLKNPGEKK